MRFVWGATIIVGSLDALAEGGERSGEGEGVGLAISDTATI